MIRLGFSTLLCILSLLLVISAVSALEILPTPFTPFESIKAKFVHTVNCLHFCDNSQIVKLKIKPPADTHVELGVIEVEGFRSGKSVMKVQGGFKPDKEYLIVFPYDYPPSTADVTLVGQFSTSIHQASGPIDVEISYETKNGNENVTNAKWNVVPKKGDLQVISTPLQVIDKNANEKDMFLHLHIPLSEKLELSSSYNHHSDSLVSPPTIYHPYIKTARLRHFGTGVFVKNDQHSCTIDGSAVDVEVDGTHYIFTPKKQPSLLSSTPGDNQESHTMANVPALTFIAFDCPIIFTPSPDTWLPDHFILEIEYVDGAPKGLPTVVVSESTTDAQHQVIVTPKSAYYPGILFCVFDILPSFDIGELASVREFSITPSFAGIGGNFEPPIGRSHATLSIPSSTDKDTWDAIIRESFSKTDAISMEPDIPIKAGTPMRLTYEVSVDYDKVEQENIACGLSLAFPRSDTPTPKYTTQSFSNIVNSRILEDNSAVIKVNRLGKDANDNLSSFAFEFTLPSIKTALKGLTLNFPLFTPYNFPTNKDSCVVKGGKSITIESISTRTLTIVGNIEQGKTLTIKCSDNIVLPLEKSLPHDEKYFLLYLGNNGDALSPVSGGSSLFNIRSAPTPSKKGMSGGVIFLIILIIIAVIGGAIGGYFYWKKKQRQGDGDAINTGNDSTPYNHLG